MSAPLPRRGPGRPSMVPTLPILDRTVSTPTTPPDALCFRFALSVNDAAAYVGLCARTIRDAIHRGELACRYSGAKMLIGRTDLESWFASLPNEPTRQSA
jgi:excisionase family DNA binding protein